MYYSESERSKNIMRHSLGIKDSMKKNSMLLVLIATMILFNGLISASGRGSLFVPANISNLISQNSYVVISCHRNVALYSYRWKH